eukprot:1272207-Pleurochrysis_carterae.AAC.1
MNIGGDGKLYDQNVRHGAMLNCKWAAGRRDKLQKDKPGTLSTKAKTCASACTHGSQCVRRAPLSGPRRAESSHHD